MMRSITSERIKLTPQFQLFEEKFQLTIQKQEIFYKNYPELASIEEITEEIHNWLEMYDFNDFIADEYKKIDQNFQRKINQEVTSLASQSIIKAPIYVFKSLYRILLNLEVFRHDHKLHYNVYICKNATQIFDDLQANCPNFELYFPELSLYLATLLSRSTKWVKKLQGKQNLLKIFDYYFSN